MKRIHLNVSVTRQSIAVRKQSRDTISYTHSHIVVGGHRIVKRSLREPSGVDNEFEF